MKQQSIPRHLVLAAIAIVLLAAADCSNPPLQPDKSASGSGERTSPAPAEHLRLPRDVHRGICLAHNWQNGGKNGYGSSDSARTLKHVTKLGADAVSLTPFGWMSGLESPEIHGEHNSDIPDGAEDRYALERVIDQAKSRRLHVVLKPHLWIRGGEWRGRISPKASDGEPAWDAWWSEYRGFITHYARIAAEHEVDEFVVGTELESAIAAAPESFVATIDAVRAEFDGHLTYGANWNEDVPDRIWKKLDAVGVQFYPPLADQPSPDNETMRANLRDHLDRWKAVADRVDRPLTLTEVGYKSVRGAAEKPYGWPQDIPADARTPDQEAQAQAYRALFAELRRVERLRGIYVWKYFTDPSRDEGGKIGFSPRAKQAEAVLEKAFESQ